MGGSEVSWRCPHGGSVPGTCQLESIYLHEVDRLDKYSLWKAQLREQALLLDERNEEEAQVKMGKSMINTIHSDEVAWVFRGVNASMFQAFPWPAGKAPWLKKNGGSGVVPDGALENVLSGFRQIHKETGESKPACKLPAPEDVPTPRNFRVCTFFPSSSWGQNLSFQFQEAQQMLALADSVVSSAMNTLGRQKKMEALLLKAAGSVLVLKLWNEAEPILSHKRAYRLGA